MGRARQPGGVRALRRRRPEDRGDLRQYDTMPITQPDVWKAPPFEARIVEQPPYKKVLIGRGATNSKGPEMAQLNALMSIKAVTGKLPVNVVFVAEGDEERMDVGVRKFVKDHPDLFKN